MIAKETGETGLITAESVESVVARYAVEELRVVAAFREVHEAEKSMRAIFDCDNIRVETNHISYDDPERAIDQLRRRVWCRIINLAGVRQMLSIKAAEELDKMLDHGKLPDLTPANVRGMMETARAEAPNHMADAVLELHRLLTPQSGRYKTNERADVGAKVVLTYWISRGFGRGKKFSAHYHHTANFRALDNVFRMLDGKPAITTHGGELADAIALSEDGRGETTYFRFKCFLNQNLHLEFKRLDLLAKLNAVAGGNRLYAPGESPKS